MKLGPRATVEPSAEFHALHKAATNAFIDEQDSEKALDFILKAIGLNPEVYSAHALLSEIHFARNEEDKAIAALFAGAHAAPRDPAVWHRVADLCLQRTSGDRQTSLQQASYCFARLIDIDEKDHDSRFQRAVINRELGNYAKALKDLDVLLKDMPRNSSVLRLVAEVCINIREIDKAKKLYEESITYHKDNGLDGDEPFTWGDINVYVDLIARDSGPQFNVAVAIQTLKGLSRWLLGRESETYWETLTDDDREWDAEDEPRRILVEQYHPGQFPLETYGFDLPLELRIKLGLFRLKQGPRTREEALAHFAWLEPEDLGEGANVFEYPDLFLEVANALYEAKEHGQALQYFEPLKHVNAYSDTDFWLGIAASSYICGKKDQAIECYEAAKATDMACGEARTQLSKLYADRGDKEKATQNALEAVAIAKNTVRRTEKRRYERKEQRLAREAAEAALKQARKLPGPGKRTIYDDLSATRVSQGPARPLRLPYPVPTADTPDRLRLYRRQRPTANENEAFRRENVLQLYTTLVNNTAAMREGHETARNIWMDCAQSLIDDFRRNRVFYPHERHVQFKGYDREARSDAFRKKWVKEQGIASHVAFATEADQDYPIPSIESTIPTDYCGILFSTWLDIFLEYALLLANSQCQQQCYTVIAATLDCTIWYHEPESTLQIYICYLTCALALDDGHTLFNVVLRWFIRQFQFCTDAYRLFAALNLFFKHPNDKGGKYGQMANAPFRTGPSQKFHFRQIMALDLNLPEDYNARGVEGPVPEFMRRTGEQMREEEGEDSEREDSHPGMSSHSGPVVIKPKEMDVVLLTLYGHILYAGGSFTNALSYFYRAYTLDPKNAVVLLSIALSYMHEMLKRQNDNRHMYLLEGWAFFEEYADARRGWAEAKDAETQAVVEREIALNRARCWHMLGMADLAVRAYEKVLAPDGHDPDRGERTDTDYTMEAAYAIQTMYALSGNTEMARHVTEKWLVVE